MYGTTNIKFIHYDYPILMELEFSGQIKKKIKYQIHIMKICPVIVELFHADRRTDVTKLIVAFRKFAKAPEKNWMDARP
jgi:hypothetical protein